MSSIPAMNGDCQKEFDAATSLKTDQAVTKEAMINGSTTPVNANGTLTEAFLANGVATPIKTEVSQGNAVASPVKTEAAQVNGVASPVKTEASQVNGVATPLKTEAPQLATAVPAKTEQNVTEVSKYSIRQNIWTLFDKNGLVSFPRPVRGRVPNFRGAVEAAQKLKETEIFQKANVVKVNADKPQEMVRLYVLEAKKRLLVSPRRIEPIALLDVQLPEEDKTPVLLKTAATRFGHRTYGKPLAADAVAKIDLFVIGSVAVTRNGRRIGKCDGYSDLEFAYLTEIGAITKDTIIATTVHDSQILDEIPDNLVCEHDIPVDLIVTPTEVIEVQPRGQRPHGIIWSMLSKRRMALSPNIAALHQKMVETGRDCHLKPEDTDEETEREIRRKHRPFIYRFPSRRTKNRRNTNENNENEQKSSEQEKTENGSRSRRRRRNDSKRSENRSGSETKNDESAKKDTKKRFAPRRYWRPFPILFSLRIGGIAATDRVRDLKDALAARNVKPAEISWYGRRGFAFVHFAKPRKAKEPVELDSVVASLKDMKLGAEVEGKEKAPVVVEPAVRTARIETPPTVAIPV